jgi:two-component system response regulator DesR
MERIEPGRIRVIVADDDGLVRELCRYLFSLTPDIRMVGEAGNAYELLHVADSTECDVVVLDLVLPGAFGLETLAELRACHPEVSVLMFSGDFGQGKALKARSMGASGCVVKGEEPETLLDSIRSAFREMARPAFSIRSLRRSPEWHEIGRG